MINLEDTTIIIPICIESPDRRLNTIITLSYLCKYLTNTNIIVLEHDVNSQVPDILNSINNSNNNKIEYIFSLNDSNNQIFHRTKFLNEMLARVKTPVVVNYDIDILLQPHVYLECSNLIKSGFDLVYPYFWGDSQYQVNNSGRNKLLNSLFLNNLTPKDFNITISQYGHCQFFNTKSYIDGGMENEGFISYAPEDQERGYRFKKLGYNVMWANNYVYHIEHSRGINSSGLNPLMKHNNELFEYIKTLSTDQLKEYYNTINYRNKYK